MFARPCRLTRQGRFHFPRGIPRLFSGGIDYDCKCCHSDAAGGKGDEELVRIVSEVIAYIKSTGLNCYVGPFETTIEGNDYDQLMDIVKECQHIAIRAGAPKVSAYIKVVYEPEGEILTIDKKVTKHHQA